MRNDNFYTITFLRTLKLESTRYFYEKICGFSIVLEEANCIIFEIGKGYWGFCENNEILKYPDRICLTIVVNNREQVMKWHDKLSKHTKVVKEPSLYAKYNLFNAFYLDPNGYTLEVQSFEKTNAIGGKN